MTIKEQTDQRRLEELERENKELRSRLQIAQELLNLQGKKLMKYKPRTPKNFFRDN